MKGIDISNNNGSIDFNKVKNSGVECIYIKATEGTTFQDSYKSAFYGGAKSIGAKVGFYHFLVGTSAPETQAENFYNQIRNCDNDLVPMLDVEVNFQGLNDYIARFVARFKQLTNIEIGIYTYTSFLNEYIDMSRFKILKLWEANYNNKPWTLPTNGFANRVGHQYTEKGHINGINTNVDMNVFNESIFLSKANISINNTNSSDWLAEYLKSWNWSGWVGKLQRTIGVNVDKIVGPITLKACTLLKKGMYGEIVRRLQEVLKAYGFNCGDIDGIFGDKTYNAVVAFQKSRGLTPDGIVGYNTWRKLLGL